MQWLLKTIGFLTCIGCFAAAALAQDQNSAPPTPQPFCESNPGFADFDFWVGEWDVYSNDEARQYQGTNSISKHYNGCLVKEQWQGAQGGGGFSINYFNSVKNEWRQVWVANGYSIDYTGGLNDDGQMVLTGHIYGYTRDSATPFRGIWTPRDDGSVIQHFDIYDESKKAWTVWFEGLYVRKDAATVSD